VVLGKSGEERDHLLIALPFLHFLLHPNLSMQSEMNEGRRRRRIRRGGEREGDRRTPSSTI